MGDPQRPAGSRGSARYRHAIPCIGVCRTDFFSHAGADPCVDSQALSNTDAHCDAGTCPFGNTDADAGADPFGNTDTHAGTYPFGDACPLSHPYSHTGTNADARPRADSLPDQLL